MENNREDKILKLLNCLTEGDRIIKAAGGGTGDRYLITDSEEEISRLVYDKENSETKIEYHKLTMSQRIELVRKCIRKIIIERQTRFIVNLEIFMAWRSIWDMELNTREKKILKLEERFLGNLLEGPKE